MNPAPTVSTPADPADPAQTRALPAGVKRRLYSMNLAPGALNKESALPMIAICNLDDTCNVMLVDAARITGAGVTDIMPAFNGSLGDLPVTVTLCVETSAAITVTYRPGNARKWLLDALTSVPNNQAVYQMPGRLQLFHATGDINVEMTELLDVVLESIERDQLLLGAHGHLFGAQRLVPLPGGLDRDRTTRLSTSPLSVGDVAYVSNSLDITPGMRVRVLDLKDARAQVHLDDYGNYRNVMDVHWIAVDKLMLLPMNSMSTAANRLAHLARISPYLVAPHQKDAAQLEIRWLTLFTNGEADGVASPYQPGLPVTVEATTVLPPPRDDDYDDDGDGDGDYDDDHDDDYDHDDDGEDYSEDEDPDEDADADEDEDTDP